MCIAAGSSIPCNGVRPSPPGATPQCGANSLTSRCGTVASISDSSVEKLAQILIRQLDARVVEILRAQAKRRGVSLEQSLRDLLTSVAAEQDDRLERLAALRRQTPAAGRQLDVVNLIQEGREQR